MVFINHFHFYLWDWEWGETFWKTNAYAPYLIGLWLNRHEGPMRQLEQAGGAVPRAGQRVSVVRARRGASEDLRPTGPAAVKRFFWCWVFRSPSPFTTADFRAGCGYALAFRQFEVSETCVFDRPQACRMWFEGVIRDHLDIWSS